LVFSSVAFKIFLSFCLLMEVSGSVQIIIDLDT
jgi:hypothetical protein